MPMQGAGRGCRWERHAAILRASGTLNGIERRWHELASWQATHVSAQASKQLANGEVDFDTQAAACASGSNNRVCLVRVARRE